MENKFKQGQYIIYRNGERYEIGKIKRVTEDGAFVYYSEGDTAAKTPFECMHKLVNEYVIRETSLGGEDGTNLAEVGTKIEPLTDKEQRIFLAAMGRERNMLLKYYVAQHNQVSCDIDAIVQLPPILPGKDKVSDLLYHIYSIQSPHLDVTGVVAKKYYCEELWKELFGKESELPGWMS